MGKPSKHIKMRLALLKARGNKDWIRVTTDTNYEKNNKIDLCVELTCNRNF